MKAQNAKLREEIQHLRGQHEIFESKLEKLNKTIETKRQIQSAMIEEGNNAFDVQLDTTMKNAALFDRNSKDKVQHRSGADAHIRGRAFPDRLQPFNSVWNIVNSCEH